MDRMPGWTDREEREPASFAGALLLSSGERIPVTITDISNDGCQVQSDERIPIGDIVTLELTGEMSTEASVRWAVSGRAGLQFRNQATTARLEPQSQSD